MIGRKLQDSLFQKKFLQTGLLYYQTLKKNFRTNEHERYSRLTFIKSTTFKLPDQPYFPFFQGKQELNGIH